MEFQQYNILMIFFSSYSYLSAPVGASVSDVNCAAFLEPKHLHSLMMRALRVNYK